MYSSNTHQQRLLMKKENIISLLASNLMRKRRADITLFNSVLNSKFIKSSFFHSPTNPQENDNRRS